MKAVVLLSSGLDSSINLYKAHKEFSSILALTFDYGQKASQKEQESARELTQALNIEHKIIDVRWIKQFSKSSLIDDSIVIPQGKSVEVDSLETSQKTAKAVWVPNRNGIFLNIAAGFAESIGADYIIPGFNKEEATTFPDNSSAFMQALDQSFYFSTSNRVKVKCYTVDMDKTEIVGMAQSLGLDLKNIWPCYMAFEKWCGQCESCLRFKRALSNNKIQLRESFLG